MSGSSKRTSSSMLTNPAVNTYDEERETAPLILNDADAHHHHPDRHHHTYYEVFFVTMPLFCGYACLFALQHEVKSLYGIKDDGSKLSHLYGIAASLVYLGNLIFRLGHNFLFFFTSPRNRVIISMTAMMLSMATITGIFFVFESRSLFWVFLAYGLGGVGIGTFESNLLSTITPLGKKTKLWAIIGIPVGVNAITVFGFILLELGVKPGYIYLAVMCYVALGIFVFVSRIYRVAGVTNSISFMEFIHQCKMWREWFPSIKWHCLALMIDMFCVSMFSPGVILYIYNAKYVTFPWFNNGRMQNGWMFAMYDAGFFLGDTLSRKIFYPRKIVFPLFFLGFALIGASIGLSSITELVPFGGFFVSFCNGSIYSQATRQIDHNVDKKYNLIAFSFWLFIGDIGSVIGSNLIPYVSYSVHNLYH